MIKRSRIVVFFLLVLLCFSTMGTTFNGIVKNLNLGLDLRGGFEILYEVNPVQKGDTIDAKTLKSTVDALYRRVDVLGVNEPDIHTENGNRIRVQLAGIKDQDEARQILSTQANLTFRDVNDKILLTGTDLVQNGAKASFDQQNKPNVTLKLKDAEKFKKVTDKILNKAPNNQIVIWLDFQKGKDSYKSEVNKKNHKFLSAANVTQVLDTQDVSITGQFTVDETKKLASLLNAGSLPVKLDEIYSTSVGAQFGDQALNSTVFAGLVGILVVYLFMIFYYRFPGIIAIITLSIYLYLTLLVFYWMHGVLTLSGMAAIILGVGMAVDANIITYERIKDELRAGRSLTSAYKAGNKRSFLTVIDANVTTLIAGVVLFSLGTGSVKGFATTLIISILISFITNIYGARLLLGLWIKSRVFNNKLHYFGVKQTDIENVSNNTNDNFKRTKFDFIDFVKYRKIFFWISGTLTVLGVISLLVLKLNLGIDFSSGTRVDIFAKPNITTSVIQQDFKSLNFKSTEKIVVSGDKNQIATVQFLGSMNKDEIHIIKKYFKLKYGTEPNVSTVSSIVGKELARDAIIAVLIASLGIIIYTAIRFEFLMAIAAIVALLHDAFLIVAFFSVTHLEVDMTFIAAVLTIIGYSINDTIVTFDRIRENMQKYKSTTFTDLTSIVNRSLRETFVRSLNTVLVVVVTVLSLLILGSESIFNFSVALLVGMIGGVYSSLFIASQLWLVWKGKSIK